MQLLLAFIVALAVTVALIPALIRMAARWGMLDLPDTRKVHFGGVPRVGGIGMVAGVIVSVVLWVPFSRESVVVLLAVSVLLVFGALDDKYELNYKWKFLGQALAAAIAVVFGGIVIRIVPFFGMDPIPSHVGVPLTIIALVGATNAVNLSDGLDGLAGGIAVLTLGGTLVLAMSSDANFVIALCVIVMAVIFGFLRFNTHPAIVFMGDAGSQFLGFMGALLAIYLTQVENTALNPALPLLLLGVPIIDTLLVMVKRMRAGRSPFSPDKNHIHHRLLATGFAHYEAVFFIYIAQAVFVITALMVRYEGDLAVTAIYLALAVTLAAGMVTIERRTHAIGRKRSSDSSGLTGLIAGVDAYLTGRQVPLRMLNVLLPVFLIMSPMIASRVSYDLVIMSSVVGVLLLARLVLTASAPYMPLRFLLYMVVAICVYLAAHRGPNEPLLGDVGDIVAAVVAGVMVIAGIMAMRYDSGGAFKTTPTDFLVLAITVTLGVVSKSSGFPEEFGRIAVLLVVSFYAMEICLRNMKSRWSVLTTGSVLAMLLVVVRGWYGDGLSWY